MSLLIRMEGWIICKKCGNKFRGFISRCPECKTPINNSYNKLGNRLKNYKLFYGRAKISILCIVIGTILTSVVYFLILPQFIVPSPPITSLKAYALEMINMIIIVRRQSSHDIGRRQRMSPRTWPSVNLGSY
ncbi:MAG: hypothetical protein JO297_18485 [Nitrososphaeraceae archaeon]|nr:hypothetical protein [Nitrososphaeraceae archaeon]